MDIKVVKEDLSLIESGGGYREVEAQITIDKTLSPRLQRQSVIYETLSMFLDPFETNSDFIDELTGVLGDVLDQVESDEILSDHKTS